MGWLLSDTTAVILAGGLGTRLRAAVADRPKVLADVAGRPFLAYLLDLLSGAGVRTVILCTGYRADQVESVFGSTYADVRLRYSCESSPLGTGGALRQALNLIETDQVVVMNGDSFCAADLPAFAEWHQMRSARASLLLARVEDTSRFGRVALASTGRIESFVEKGETIGPGLINAGVYVLDRDLLCQIPLATPVSLEREVFPAWMETGLHGYPTEAAFIDIGLPSSYALAEDFLQLQLQLQLRKRAA
jgi:NDP-sugar pyrophosphorylase family protein